MHSTDSAMLVLNVLVGCEFHFAREERKMQHWLKNFRFAHRDSFSSADSPFCHSVNETWMEILCSLFTKINIKML